MDGFEIAILRQAMYLEQLRECLKILLVCTVKSFSECSYAPMEVRFNFLEVQTLGSEICVLKLSYDSRIPSLHLYWSNRKNIYEDVVNEMHLDLLAHHGKIL